MQSGAKFNILVEEEMQLVHCLFQEKLNKVQYAEEQARVEKERSELDVMKLERELEKLQYQVRLITTTSISNNFPQCQRWNCWRRGAPAEWGIVETAAAIDPEAGENIEEKRFPKIS